MVVFTCGHCGESVQKPKVEKHYLTKCRNRNPNLSCMDCFKDFLGNDYEAHIKCITEEERYSGKGFTAKEKKGEKKQNAWVEMLQSVLDESKTTSPNVLRIIETISKHNNTPRKKPKFINFVKNVCGQKTNPKDIDQAWDLISVKLSALSNLNAQNKNQEQKNDTSENNGKSSNKYQNGDINEKENVIKENNENEAENNISIATNGHDDLSTKTLSKKQRKEEKKRRKYEAELHSAEKQPAEEEVGEIQLKKKGKKNKNKVNGTEETEDGQQLEGKNKNKKRKRQDTVNTVPEVIVNEVETENTSNNVKVQQKKQKVQVEEISASLHEQNIASNEEATAVKEKFDWHSVIVSVLQKKDNEVPFKRLQKKVLAEYSEITGNDVDDRIAEKFIKKLKSAPNVRVDKNRVMLVQEDDDK
ncbi:cell growth-regulating nucleolar protein-like [Battus philenor]|uniref:cell growth-regulating nucleolar protein-like n=1 Tax=Battus philenor TaxID=42288 RepID=UPI0035CF3DEE